MSYIILTTYNKNYIDISLNQWGFKEWAEEHLVLPLKMERKC
jgi:hypothetical protein